MEKTTIGIAGGGILPAGAKKHSREALSFCGGLVYNSGRVFRLRNGSFPASGNCIVFRLGDKAWKIIGLVRSRRNVRAGF